MLPNKLALVCGCALAVGSAAHAASLLGDTDARPGWRGPTGFVSWNTPTGFVSVAHFAGTGNGLLLSSGFAYKGTPPNIVGDTTSVIGVAGYVDASVDVGGRDQFDAGPATEGSAVKRTFTARPGDVLTVAFDFLSREGSASVYQGLSEDELPKRKADVNDFAFIAITHAGHTDVTRLADVLSPTMTDVLDADGERIWSHTGLLIFTLSLLPGPDAFDGNYTIAFGVMNGAGPANPVNQPFIDQTARGYINESQLHVFSVDVSGPTPVPLPAAAPAGFALLAGCAAVRRLRRHAR